MSFILITKLVKFIPFQFSVDEKVFFKTELGYLLKCLFHQSIPLTDKLNNSSSSAMLLKDLLFASFSLESKAVIPFILGKLFHHGISRQFSIICRHQSCLEHITTATILPIFLPFFNNVFHF